MRSKLMLSAAMAAAGLALAGCGGGGTGNGAATTGGGTETAGAETAKFDACSVLTTAEVEAITTDKVTKVKDYDGTCFYSSNPSEDLRVTVKKTGGTKAMEIVHRTAGVLSGMGASVKDKGGAGADAAELLKKDQTAAPKLGDEAVWRMNTTLSIRKGDMFVEVTPPMMHDPANHEGYPLIKTEEKRAIAQKIAEKVLSKLN